MIEFESNKDFDLYTKIFVPPVAEPIHRVSMNIYKINGQQRETVAQLIGTDHPWKPYYEPFMKDFYLEGMSFEKKMPSGKYEIEVYSGDNQNKYALLVGKTHKNFFYEMIFNISILRNIKVKFFSLLINE